ncbi:MAG: hypothetical protein J2P14_14920 [Acidothermales bacterium]|nr:hypothetical protein [Acidothermales bacterium]
MAVCPATSARSVAFRLFRRAAIAGGAALAARVAYRALTSRPPGGAKTWARTNHRGEPVTLLEGPAAAVGAGTALALIPGLPGRLRLAGALCAAGTAGVGAFDDLAGSGDSRGFRGHLGALTRGEVTTGMVKIAGIGVVGLASSALVHREPVDVLLGGLFVAAGANLVNLFDLRPGRALKVVLAHAPAVLAGTGVAGDLAAAPVGAAAGLVGVDLDEQAMLGDAGANALGALLALAGTAGLSRRTRLVLLLGTVGLTAASEVVSFTGVIQQTPPLRVLDELGRRPRDERPPAEPTEAT